MHKDYLSKLKSLVNTNNQWEAFCDMLDYNINLQHKKLEQANDPVEVYRAQGAIAALRSLKYLKDEINVK
jgi:predicted transcriptional regulator